jgi:c-di-AMP phosphodiesterase-like protein
MNTLRKMNRPIKFFGLTSGQFGLYALFIALMIIVMIFRNNNSFLIVGIVTTLIIGSSFLFRRLQKEHKAGNPDYITSISIKSAIPKKIVDKNKIFKFIYNDGQNKAV